MNTNTDWRIVVEPNELTRRGLVRLMRDAGHLNCAAFETIEEMESDIDSEASDAMLLVNLGRDENFVTRNIERLKSHHQLNQIVLLSDQYSHSHLHCALNAGASSYLLTDMSCKALIQSLEVISLGQPVIPTEAFELISDDKAKGLSNGLPFKNQSSRLPSGLLADLELVVSRSISEAMSNNLISHKSNIHEVKARMHVKAILRKINEKPD